MKPRHWLLLIFIVTLAVRLFLAFSQPNFTYESYFHLRQADHITTTGLPLYNDPLSYGGRELRFLPLFHYLAALFNLFLPLDIVAKILPNLLFASLTIIIYHLARRITPTKQGPLFSAFIAGFLPILFTTNSFTPSSLFIPLVFLAIYAFLNLPQHLLLYIVTFLLLSFTSSATILLLIGFGFYLLLSFLEQKKVPAAELELVIASLFFFVWAQFLFFRDSLIKEGFLFIWQNIPATLLQDYFPKFSIGQALVAISILPFLGGIIMTYRHLFQLKNQPSFLLISLILSTAILSLFRLIQLQFALAFYGLIAAVLFAAFYEDSRKYVHKTRVHHYQKYLPAMMLGLLILSLLPPAIAFAKQQQRPSPQEMMALRWINENLPEDATIIAPLDEGQFVTYYGQRKNVVDDQFYLIKDIDQRFTDVQSVYTTAFETQALSLLEKYQANYILFTPHSQERYGLTTLKYYTPKCFEEVYNHETVIYRRKCSLKRE